MLELKKLRYEVEEKVIIDNLSLSFLDNKITVITGQNGSGKSTLAKLIMGLIEPTSGKIYLNSKDVTKCTIQERVEKGLSFAFQQPVRFKGLTVKHLLDTASVNQFTIKDLCLYLSQVGLCARDYIFRPLDDKLSGGELKRIEIAMTLAQDKPYMIFDEPEAGIDLWSFEELVGLFHSLKEKGKTVIVISHQERILNMADQIVVLSQGKVIDCGTKEKVMPALNKPAKCGKLNLGGKENE